MPVNTNPIDALNPQELSYLSPKKQTPNGTERLVGYNKATDVSNLNSGLINADNNPDYIKAVNQGFWRLAGNSIGKIVNEATLGTAENIGYMLDFQELGNLMQNKEDEFGNWWSDKMKEWKQNVDEKAVPIYTLPKDQEFSLPNLVNGRFWATGLPSVATSLSLLIPTAGAVKGLSSLAKITRGVNLAKKLGASAELLGATEALTAGLVSRRVENTLEAQGAFDKLYYEAIAAGKSDEEAQVAAGQAARDTWWRNTPLMLMDAIQYGIAFKSFNKLNEIKNIGKGELLGQIFSESGEEIYQYVNSEEAIRQAAMDNDIREKNYAPFSTRLLRYAKDGELWASAFFGGLGGGVFAGATSVINKYTEKQKIKDQLTDSMLEKDYAIRKGNPELFIKSQEQDLIPTIVNKLVTNKTNEIDDLIDSISSLNQEALDKSGIDKEEFTQKVNTLKEDVNYIKDIFNKRIGDIKTVDPQILRYELTTRLLQRSEARNSNRLEQKQLTQLDEIIASKKINPLLASYISTYITSIALSEFEKNADYKDVYPSKKEEVDKLLELNKQSVLESGIDINEQQLSDIVNNIDKSNISNTAVDKTLADLKLLLYGNILAEIQNVKGQKKVKDVLSQEKEKEKNESFDTIKNSITPTASFSDLGKLRKDAKDLGKEQEFIGFYKSKLNSFRNQSPKFDPLLPGPSLVARYNNNPLVRDHELTELSKLTETPLDVETLTTKYLEDEDFKTTVDNYFNSLTPELSATKKDDLKNNSLSTSNVDSNEEEEKTLKDKDKFFTEKAPKNPFNLQAVQFEFDNETNEFKRDEKGKLIPTNTNVSKKIDWNWLNNGDNLKVGELVHFEYDFDDEYNKGNVTENTAFIEAVYYVDKNTLNKSKENRKVLGALSSYNENTKYTSEQSKKALKELRENLWKRIQSNSTKTGITNLGITTKVNKKLGGRFFNIQEFSSPHNVLRDGDELVLGIGRIIKTGETKSAILDIPNHPYSKAVRYSTVTPGMVYMMLKDANGDILPYKLFTTTLENNQEEKQKVSNLLVDLEFSKTPDKVVKQIQDIVFIKSIRFDNGELYADTGSVADDTSKEEKITDINNFLNNLILQVDINKINRGTYNVDISKKGYISTDINPGNYFHSAKISIQPQTQSSKVVSTDIKIDDSGIKSVNLKFTKPGVVTQKLDNVGSTKLNLNDEKTKLVDNTPYYEKINIPKATEWFQKRFPNTPLSFVDNLIEINKHGGVKAWGVFRNAAVEISKIAPQSTVYHEAFHVAFEFTLNDKQKKDIINEKRQSDTTLKDKSDLEIEEIIADEFADYIIEDEINSQSLGYNIRQFFKKLYDAIKFIFTSNVNIDDFFFRINNNEFINTNIQNEYLNNTVRYKLPNTDPYIIKSRVRLLNSQFFKALDEIRSSNAKYSDLNDIELLNNLSKQGKDQKLSGVEFVYGRVLNGLIDAYQNTSGETSEKLADLISNFVQSVEGNRIKQVGDYWFLAIRDLSNFGIDVTLQNDIKLSYDDLNQDTIYEINEEEDALEGWQINQIRVNGKDTLSYNIRKILRQTPALIKQEESFVEDTDDLGFPKYMEFDEIYNYLERNLSNIYDSNEILEKLNESASYKPELYSIINKLEEDDQLKSQFFSNFSKSYLPHLLVNQRINTNYEYGVPINNTQFFIFNANRKTVNQLLINDWRDNLKIPSRNSVTNNDGTINKEKANKYLKEYKNLVTELRKKDIIDISDSKKVSNILEKFGITVSPESIQNEYREKAERFKKQLIVTKPIINYINLLDSQYSFNSILENIASSNSPFEGENTSLQKVSEIIARSEKDLYQTTHIDVNGNQVYSHILPNFLTKLLNQLKTPEGVESYLSNWYYKRNKWLQDLQELENRDELGLVLLDGLKLNNKRGKKYEDLTDKNLTITDLNMYYNNSTEKNQTKFAYYRLPILSDSPQAPFIRFRKYSKEEVIDALYNVALTEKDRIELVSKDTDLKIKNFHSNKKFNFISVLNDFDIDISDENKVKKTIEAWLEENYRQELLNLQELGIINQQNRFLDSAVPSSIKDHASFLNEWFYNSVLSNTMITQLTSGDLSFYKDSDIFQKRNAQVFKFVKYLDVNSRFAGKEITNIRKHYNTIYLEDNIIKSDLYDVVKELLGEDTAKIYNKVNQTDAQTYITLPRYREIQIGLGLWNNKKDEAFNKAMKGETISDFIFNPIKPFYFGHELVGNIINPVQNKNSEFVLLPSMAKKSEKLNSLLNYMMKNDIDSVQFNSSVKVGEYGTTKFENILDDTRDQPIVHKLLNENYGIQQETPAHHIDTDNLLGSQIKKLILNNINFNNKYLNGMSGKEIFDLYHKVLSDNIKEDYQKVNKELGDIKNVQKILLDEVHKRNLGEQYEEALKIVKDNKGEDTFAIPLFHPIQSKRIENIFNGIIRNSIIKQKINGASLVLVSNFGFDNNLKVVVNQKTKAVEYMEVMLPAWSKNKFPKLPNGEVDFDRIKENDPSILDLIGYRIPTEGKYSMKKLKVVGFTPENAGGIALLPAEITTIAGEDFDIDKMYVMIPNSEYKNGKLQKVKYNLDNIEENSREAKDNLIIDIISSILNHPSSTEEILKPGGFNTLKELKKNISNRQNRFSNTNPIFPETQREFFNRNMNGAKLIGLAANHNTNHSITQFTKASFSKSINFDGKTKNELFQTKDIKGNLISRNIAEFLAAFVDNAKDPVANDLNLNFFTFDTVMSIVRTGFPLETAIAFINQPIIKEFSNQYFRDGGTQSSEVQAYNDLVRKLVVKAKSDTDEQIYSFNTGKLLDNIGKSLQDSEYYLEQLQVLKTFKIYRDQAKSLSRFVRATRADTIGTSKSIATNEKFLDLIDSVILDKNLTGIDNIFNEKETEYPLVAVATKYGISLPMNEIINKYFPFNNSLFRDIHSTVESIKGEEITADEIDFVNSQVLNYFVTGFNGFNTKERESIIKDTPKKFENLQKELRDKYDIIKYLKYAVANENIPINRIEFTSISSVSNEQRTFITRSLEALLQSDNKDYRDLGNDLIKYSLYTSGFNFTPNSFGHLIPISYFENLTDSDGNKFSDYMNSLLEVSKEQSNISAFIDQLYRNKFNSSIIRSVSPKAYTKADSYKGIIHTITVNPKLVRSQNLFSIGETSTDFVNYFETKSPNNNTYTYKISTVNEKGEAIYKIQKPLGIENFIYELDKSNIQLESVLPNNKLPDFPNITDPIEDEDETFYQLDEERQLERHFGLRNEDDNYKKYAPKNYIRDIVPKVTELNKKLNGTRFKAVAIKVAGKKGDNKVYQAIQIVDRFKYQLEGDEVKPDKELNILLNSWMVNNGIKLEYWDDLKQRLGVDAIGAADITNKLILISKNLEDKTTLPEEVGHFVEAFNRNTPLHDRLMTLITGTKAFKDSFNQYNDIYNDTTKVKQEVIGKLIGEAIIKNNNESKQSISSSLLELLNKLWNNFINLFKTTSEIELQQEIENIVGSYASDVLTGKVISKDIKDDVFFKIKPTIISKEKDVLENAIEALNKRIKIFEGKVTEENIESKKELLQKLNTDLENKVYISGLLNFVDHTNRELNDNILPEYDRIKNLTFSNIDEARGILSSLKKIHNYSTGFGSTLNEIYDVLKDSGLISPPTLSEIASTIKTSEKLDRDYFSIGKPILAEILKEFSSNNTLDIEKSLDFLEKDISYSERFLDALAETTDPISKIIDIYVKEAKHRARKNVINVSKDLIKLKKKLEAAGIPSTQFMYERDWNGKLTGNFVTEYNIGQWKANRDQFFKSNPKPKSENYADKKEYTKALRLWKQEVGKWFRENTQVHPSKEEVVENKRKELRAKYSNDKIFQAKFDEWIFKNAPEDRYGNIIYKGDLTIPGKQYKSSQFEEIQKNEVQKEFFDHVHSLYKNLNSKLKEKDRLNGLAPQVRKDFVERLLQSKGLTGIKNETAKSLAEMFVRHENDVDFGITDQAGNPIQSLPVFFNRKLDNVNDLSLDVVSTMTNFAYMANNYSEMNRIVDVVEFTKDIVGERKVGIGKNDPVSFFKRDKPIVIEGKNSLAYQRLVDYLDMVVYGNVKKDEGSVRIFGTEVDKAKAIDTLGSYVSLNSLALNIYAGISNITLGGVMLRTESFSKEFFDNGDLLQADKIYTSELPDLFAEIGARQKTSKLELMLEYMDTLQSYSRDIRDIEAERKTKAWQLAKLSSLYFVNHAGEHWLQSRLMLALTNRIKVKNSNGEIIPLWDAFEVEGDRIKLVEGITKVGGKKHSDLFKENEDGQPLTERDVNRVINRQNFLNKRLHGIYNDIDKSTIQKYALGRMAIMFRKFIKPGFNRRFEKLTYNEEGEIYTEGYYRSTYNFMSNLFGDLKQGKFAVARTWENLNDTEKANIMRTLVEAGYTIGVITLAAVLTNMADDDEDDWALNLAAYEAYRLYSELRFYTAPSEALRILKSPAAAIHQFDKIGKFLSFWNWTDEIERGKYKGLTKGQKSLIEVLPLTGTYYNFHTPEEQLKFFTNNGVTIF